MPGRAEIGDSDTLPRDRGGNQGCFRAEEKRPPVGLAQRGLTREWPLYAPRIECAGESKTQRDASDWVENDQGVIFSSTVSTTIELEFTPDATPLPWIPTLSPLSPRAKAAWAALSGWLGFISNSTLMV